MRYVSKTSLYKYGMAVCERKILPRLVQTLEPKRGDITGENVLLEVDSLVTEFEVKTTLENYQVAGKGLVMLFLLLLSAIPLVMDKLVASLPLAPVIIDILMYGLDILLSVVLAIFWLGIYERFNGRWKEWQTINYREVMLEKIEYQAKMTSSAIIAEILFEIEKLRETQEQESTKVKAYRVMQNDTFKVFDEMMTRRESKGRLKSFFLGNVTGFFLTYFGEKGLDWFLFKKTGIC